MARPQIEINERQVEALAALFCTNDEIGAVVGCSVDTLTRRFADAIKKGKDRARASLRRLQYKAATAGNPTMLIWLGKQYLEQKDKVEIEARTDSAREHAEVIRRRRQQREQLAKPKASAAAAATKDARVN